MVTSDPVRDRMVPFTRSMSAVKNPIRRAMEGGEGFSNGTMTAKGSLREARTRDNRNAMVGGQVRQGGSARSCPLPKFVIHRRDSNTNFGSKGALATLWL